MRWLILLSALPLTACDMNPLVGEPSEFQRHTERVALVAEPVTASVSVAAIEPAPEPIQVCAVTFRINRCGENGEILPW